MRLREYTLADLDDLAAMFADAEHMRYYERPKTREEAAAWIDWNLGLYAEHGFGLWVAESIDRGEFLGNVGLTPQTVDEATDIEVGWHIKRDYWNRGLATEAAVACRDYGFDNLGLKRLISIVHPDNMASRRVAEKIGMAFEKETVRDAGTVLVYSLEVE